MSEYNLNLNIKIEADNLIAAYAKVTEVLNSIQGNGNVTKVDLQEPKHSSISLHGHTSGCRQVDGRGRVVRGAVCTCGPVPR